MRLPVIKGIIKRRILINYQVDPEIISKYLPSRFSPKVVHGKSIIGVCLIRLEQMHPKMVPVSFGFSSENAAHRIAVQWKDELGTTRDGVYIFRRDTNSKINRFFGGKLFPGEHNRAVFTVNEINEDIHLTVNSSDGKVNISIKASPADMLPDSSLFKFIDDMSDFFKTGSEGYSPVMGKNCYQGMCLLPYEWNMQPLVCEELKVSYFTKTLGLREDQLCFDSLVMMKDIAHEWQALHNLSNE